MPFDVVAAVSGIADAVGAVGAASGIADTIGAIGGVASAVGDAFGGGGGGSSGGGGGGSSGGTNNQQQTGLAQQYLNQQQARSTADAAKASLSHPEQGNAAAAQQQGLADPFSPYRSGFAQQYSSALQPGANLPPEGLPGFSQFKSGILDPSMQATQRSLNASGQFASGNEQIALEKTAQQGYSGFMSDYLNRLSQGSGAGNNPATAAGQGMQAKDTMNQMVGQAAGADQYAKAQGQQLALNAVGPIGSAIGQVANLFGSGSSSGGGSGYDPSQYSPYEAGWNSGGGDGGGDGGGGGE